MKNRIFSSVFATMIFVVAFSFLAVPVQSAGVGLSADEQWIEGLYNAVLGCIFSLNVV